MGRGVQTKNLLWGRGMDYFLEQDIESFHHRHISSFIDLSPLSCSTAAMVNFVIYLLIDEFIFSQAITQMEENLSVSSYSCFYGDRGPKSCLMRTLWSIPLVSVLARFDCNILELCEGYYLV